MIRMFRRETVQVDVGVGLDEVILATPLPSGSRLNGHKSTWHIEATAAATMNTVFMYMMEAWILPVLDPDSAALLTAIWDTLVPKDTDVQVLDLDTASADTAPFFEPGEADFSALFEVGLRPERIYQKRKMVSFASNPLGLHILANDTTKWWTMDTFECVIKKNYAINQPSVLLFGFASPALDDTTSTGRTIPTENQWSRIKYIAHVLQQAQMDLLGLTEAGSETPWEEATDLLQLHTEPDVFEQNAGAFVGATWRVVADSITDHSVVGELGKTTISTGR